MKNISQMVSVIIPTYKRNVKILERAVQSVRNQTYDNLEIIVIDDSPENFEGRKAVQLYMDDLIQRCNHVIYIKNEKSMGGALARNRGIDVCRGTFVTFLDDDDEYKPLKIEKQVQFMQDENCDMSFTDMLMVDDLGHIVDVRSYPDVKKFDNNSLLRYHLTRKLTGTPSFMYKTAALREIGGFDDAKMGQEFYLMLKSIKNNLSIRYLNECEIIVHKHTKGGISQGTNKITGENAVFQTILDHKEFLTKEELKFATFRHWAVLAVAYKRNKMYGHMIKSGIIAICKSPRDFFVELRNFLNKIRAAKNR